MRTRPEDKKSAASDPRASDTLLDDDTDPSLAIGEDVIEMILQNDIPINNNAVGQPIRAHMILTPSMRPVPPDTPYSYNGESLSYPPYSPSIAEMLEFSPEEPVRVKRERSPSTSINAAVDGEPSDVKRARDDMSDEKVRQKKALAARSSRQKHKEYVQTLQKENEELRERMKNSERLSAATQRRMSKMEEEILYLRRVIANDGAIGRLIRHLPSVEELTLSSSMIGEVQPQGGICLHLMNNRKVSLELCAACAANAQAAAGPSLKVRNPGLPENDGITINSHSLNNG